MRMNAIYPLTSFSEWAMVFTAVYPFAYPCIQYKKCSYPQNAFIHSTQERNEPKSYSVTAFWPRSRICVDVKSCQSSPDVVETDTISQYPLGKGGGSIWLWCNDKGLKCIIHPPVQFSHSVVSDNLWPHGLQHTRPLCPLLTTQTHVHWVSDAIQPSHLLSSPSSPTFNLSQHQGLFQWVSSSHQVAKVLWVSASASVLPINIQDWFPLMDWLDLLEVQGTLKSLLQHHSSKESILQRYKDYSTFFIKKDYKAFFIVQLSHPYMTTGEKP